MDPYDDNEYGGSGALVQCRICDRSFAPEALSRHAPICAKSKAKKERKAFDSAKQRAEGTEINTVKKKTTREDSTRLNGSNGRNNEPPVRRNDWRQKHEDFINTIRSARGAQLAVSRGGPLPPPPPPTINPDYIQCDYCGRRFNENAAERHINFCREKNQRLPAARPNQTTAAQKQAIRTQYQPPKPRTTVSSTGGVASFSVTSSGGRGPVKTTSYTATSSATSANRGGSSKSMTGGLNAVRYGVGESGRTGGMKGSGNYDDGRQMASKPRTTGSSSINSKSSTVSGSSSSTSASRRPAPTTGASRTTAGPSGGSRAPGQGPAKVAPMKSGDYLGNFCMDCGVKFPTPSAKFCSNCGAKK